VGVQSVAVDRAGVPFEETSRRLWTRKMIGSGLGRLCGHGVAGPSDNLTVLA